MGECAEDRLRLWLTFLVVAALRGVLSDDTVTTVRVSRREVRWWSGQMSNLNDQTGSVHAY